VLCSRELIEVDQDVLGQQAKIIRNTPTALILAKDLEDGSKAVGLFNRSHSAAPITATWADLGLSGKQKVRDLWQQKDLGEFSGLFTTHVPRHGVMLVRISPAKYRADPPPSRHGCGH